MRRGILGGTFDPAHIGHLVAGEVARQQLGLDVVSFFPAGAPWQKAGKAVSAPQHRVTMTRLAVEGIEGFEVDEREARRAGWTYTIDTLDEFDRDEELTLILGADAAAGLATWERAPEIVERVVVAVAPRPGTDLARVESAVSDPVWLDMPRLEVSGTEIRERAAAGRSFRFLVPEAVWRYVLEQGLYR